MGFRGTCDNYLFGPTRCPFNTNKNSGGSSGESAAAVADGMLPIAEGTDAGGSIQIPSAWCGVYVGKYLVSTPEGEIKYDENFSSQVRICDAKMSV